MANPWYARYTADYGRDTAYLTMIEHGAYTLLLDYYYSTGGPLQANAQVLYRVCRAFEPEEQAAVNKILSIFFDLTDEGYTNSRADKEIMRSKEVSESRKKAASAGWGNEGREKRAQRLKAAKEKGTHTKAEWEALLSAFGHACAKCGAYGPDVRIEKDHVIPLCSGGSDAISNLQPLCKSCNSGRNSAIEDHRPAAMKRIAEANENSQGRLHTQSQSQSHIEQQQQHAGATKQEAAFAESFDSHEDDLKRVFPHADFEAEKITCIAHYANAPSVGPDPYPTICKWFNRIPRSTKVAPLKRESLSDSTRDAAREFCQ